LPKQSPQSVPLDDLDYQHDGWIDHLASVIAAMNTGQDAPGGV
jgi:hypothetical protein